MKLYTTVSAFAVVLALVLAGCGNGGEESGDEPAAEETPAAEEEEPTEDMADEEAEEESTEDTAEADAEDAEPVAAGELTEFGTTLGVGETATVLDETTDEESTVEATVSEPRAGTLDDFADYDVPEELEGHVPHYVDISVTNVGDGNLENGRFRVRGVTSGDQVVVATVVAGFDECASTSYPSDFTNGASVDTCMVFMLPEGEDLVGVQYSNAANAEDFEDVINWAF